MASSEPVLYLVRVWHGGHAFRAAARRVDQDTLHLAHSAQELAAYLAGDGVSPAPTATATAKPCAGPGGVNPGPAALA